jgi:hypothetical protein
VPLLSAHDLCTAVETVLLEHLPTLAASRGLKKVTKWDQLPTVEALTAANLPAGAITSPGLTEPPTRRTTGHTATWRIVIGVYDRGRDYKETQSLTRRWAAVVRQVLVQHPTLGGVATGVQWIGEEYAERPERSSARTLGGCAVLFDVTATDVIDSTPYVPPDQPGSEVPVVQSTQSTVTVRRPSPTQE